MSTFTITLRSVVVAGLAGAAAIGLAAGPAAAEKKTEPVALHYRLDRSQLATEEGAAKAYRELTIQAREACRFPGTHKLEAYKVDERCASDLVAKVVAASKDPTLTRRHAQMTGGALPRG